MQRTVVLMVKEPRPGRVKTRLGREIGMAAAAWWFRHQVAGLLRRIRDPRWRIVLAVTPDRAGRASRVWPRDLPRLPQGHGDLGARIVRAVRAAGPGPVLVIGSDIPGITRAHLSRAFRALGTAETVIGPALDGGYWLIGFRGPHVLKAGALEGVRWSGPLARADTVASLGDLRAVEVDVLADVDEAADLRQSA